MKAYKLIAAAAAILLTVASLRAVLYNVNTLSPTNTGIDTPKVHVTNLAPVVVRPTAAEKRAAALINDTTSLGLMTLPASPGIDANASVQSLSLLGSPLVMPYYSFGKKFGRITKE
jgi:hypothetical protein